MVNGRRFLLLAAILLISMGIIGLITSIFLGQARVLLIVFFPIVVLKGWLPVLSVIAMMSGFFLILTTRILHIAESRSEIQGHEMPGNSEFGGIIFLGPIPIFFGTGGFGNVPGILKYLWLFLIAGCMILILIFLIFGLLF
jgi:uncharacterized membrane protein